MPRSVDLTRRKYQCEESIQIDARDVLRNRQMQDGCISATFAGDGYAQGAGIFLERQVEGWSRRVIVRYILEPHTMRPLAPAGAAQALVAAGIAEELAYAIEIESTPQHLGEQRHWLRCPLIDENDRKCNRRVRVLYLPHGAKYFGCRHCQGGIAYRSQQEHKTKMAAQRRAWSQGLAPDDFGNEEQRKLRRGLGCGAAAS